MKPGHSKANCKSRVKSFKCQSFGHHTALCRNIDKVNEEDKNKPANANQKQKNFKNYLACHDKSISLQTAGVITNMDKSKAKSVHILFEFHLQSSCSGVEKAVEALSSEPVDGGNRKIKTK